MQFANEALTGNKLAGFREVSSHRPIGHGRPCVHNLSACLESLSLKLSAAR